VCCCLKSFTEKWSQSIFSGATRKRFQFLLHFDFDFDQR
jgi:hypothetical protein